MSPLANARALNIVSLLVIVGLSFILIANLFSLTVLKVHVDRTLANIGSLLLITGILQFLYDAYVKKELFEAIQSKVVRDTTVRQSGISEYYTDSKHVDFSSEFLTSKNVIIGVNYSAKLIDNAIGLVQQRMDAKKPIVIVHIDQDSDAAKFLEADHGGAQVSAGIQKIADIVADCNREGKYITIKTVDTVLRYSFVSFDSRIWIVAGTNGLGRRKVPGFFVTSPSSWYDHYSDDIMRLIDRAPAP